MSAPSPAPTPSPTPTPSPAPTPSPRLPDPDELRTRLADACERARVPGAVLGVSVGGERVVVAHGVRNVATGDPMTVDTVNQVASVSKVFTATTLLLLCDEHGVGLDTPAADVLPELAGVDDAVTIRRLLDHSSGVQCDLFDDFGPGPDAIGRYAAAVPGIGSVVAPGRFCSYSNAGYVALGRLVERLGGGSFDRVLARRLFAPLGTERTTMRLDEAVLHRVAVGHDLGAASGPEPRELRVRPWIDQRSISPTGGVISCVPDLLRLCELHLADGGDLLAADTARAMRVRSSTSPDPWTAGPGWGLGLTDCTGPDGEAVWGHDGLGVGLAAYVRIVPGRRCAVAMTGAAGHTRPAWQALWSELLREQGMQMPAMPEPGAGEAAGLHADLDRYVGRWSRLSQDLEVRVGADGGLELVTTPTGVLARFGQPTTAPLRPVGPDVFAVRATTGVDAAVVFTDEHGATGGSGRAAYVHTGLRATPRAD